MRDSETTAGKDNEAVTVDNLQILPNSTFFPITPLPAQISASNFHDLTQITQRRVCFDPKRTEKTLRFGFFIGIIIIIVIIIVIIIIISIFIAALHLLPSLGLTASELQRSPTSLEEE